MRKSEAKPGVTTGNWTLLSGPIKIGRRNYVKVECSCGRKQKIRLDSLPPVGPKTAASTRCTWCSRATNVRDMRATHPLYYTWRAMLARCQKDARGSAPNWRHYGGRGIEVCDRWKEKPNGFWNFVHDVGPRPEGHTLDRIDVNGDYEPDNVRWSTPSRQRRNQRRNSPF